MSNIEISQAELKSLINYDPDTGIFRWAKSRVGCKKDSIAGNLAPHGYIRICINRTPYLAHRLAWFYVTGEWPSFDIDHIDGKPSNNAFCNLRDVKTHTNVQNVKGARCDSKTKLLGVDMHKRDGLYRARIMVQGKRKCLGYFKDMNEAYAVYLDAKRRLHEGCTI